MLGYIQRRSCGEEGVFGWSDAKGISAELGKRQAAGQKAAQEAAAKAAAAHGGG